MTKPRYRTRARWVPYVVLLVLFGCQSAHQQKKQQSETQWRQVRADVKYKLALQQFQGGLTGEAAKTVVEAIALETQNPAHLILLAQVRLEQGDLHAAREAAQKALGLDEKNAEAHYTLGTIEERAGNLAPALACFESAAELDPAQLDYLRARAECLVSLDRSAEALHLISAARGRFPRDATLESLLAQIADMTGQFDLAAEAYRRALDLKGDDSQLSEQLALALMRLDRHSEVIGVLKPLWDRHDEGATPTMVRALARAYLHLRNPRTAGEVLDEYLEKHDSDRELWGLRAEAAIRADQPEAAQRCLDRLTTLSPNHVDLNLLRAYLLQDQGRPAEARQKLDLLLVQRDNVALVHWLYAQVLFELGEASDAGGHFQRAVELDPALSVPAEFLARTG